MRTRLLYIRLSMIYYANRTFEKLMALAFNIDFVIRHRRRPRRATRKQVREFKKFLDAKKGGKE